MLLQRKYGWTAWYDSGKNKVTNSVACSNIIFVQDAFWQPEIRVMNNLTKKVELGHRFMQKEQSEAFLKELGVAIGRECDGLGVSLEMQEMFFDVLINDAETKAAKEEGKGPSH